MPYRVMRYEAADKCEIPVRLPRVAQTLIPVSLTPPLVFGIGQVGQTLSAYPGQWLNSPTFTYQWFRGNLSTSITSPSASPTYVPVTADIANLLYVGVTGTNPYGAVTDYSTALPYGTFQTTLNGSPPSFIYSFPGTPAQEVNHLHQSPAGGQYIVMTTYTLPPYNEATSYLGTAMLLQNTASGIVNTVVPANPAFSNANGEWWFDGQSFVYSSSNMTGGPNPSRHGARRYFPATNTDGIYYNPNMSIADFSISPAGAMVLGGQTTINGFQTSALFVYYGGILTQLTTPNVTGSFNPSGDVDPQWSPSGNYITCSRSVAPGLFTVVVINVTGPPWVNVSETVITPPGSAAAFDGVGCWSDNDQWIVTWYTDPANRAANGIYYYDKLGNNRTRINLQAQAQFNDPSFVSGSGFGALAKVLFSTGLVQPIFGALPANTVLPAITGSATVGNTLVGQAGTWINGATLTYQWARGGMPVMGQTTLASYVVTSADVGFHITLIETATSTSGAGYVSATSNPTPVVGGGDSLNLGLHLSTDSMPLAT